MRFSADSEIVSDLPLVSRAVTRMVKMLCERLLCSFIAVDPTARHSFFGKILSVKHRMDLTMAVNICCGELEKD